MPHKRKQDAAKPMETKTLIEKVSASSGIDRATCEALLEALARVSETAMAEGDSVSVPSFGTFEPRKRNERIITHPSTPGKKLLVPPKVVVSFKPSTTLKNRINNGKEDE